MVAKNWIYGIAGGVLLALVLLFILAGNIRMPWASLSVWEAVPHSSAIMVHTNIDGLHRFQHQLGSIPGLPGSRILEAMDSSWVHLGLAGQSYELVLAGWNMGAAAPSYIVSIDMKNQVGKAPEWLEKKADSLKLSRVRGHDNTYQINIGEQPFLLSAYKNILVLSTGSLATEAANQQLRAYKSRLPRIRAMKRLMHLHKDNDNPVMYVQWDAAGPFAGPVFKPGYPVENLKDFGWMSFELSDDWAGFKHGQGFWQPDYPRDVLKQLASVQPGNWNFHQHIPQNAMQVLVMSHDEDRWPEILSRGSSEFFRLHIQPWLGKGAALVTLEPLSEPVRGFKAMVLDIGNDDVFDATLGEKLLESVEDQIFEHREYRIFMLDEQEPVGEFFGKKQNVIYKPYAVKREGVLIMANHLNHLRQWLDALDLEQGTLKNLQEEPYLFAWQFNPALAMNLPELYARDEKASFWINFLHQMETLNEGLMTYRYHLRGFEARYRGFFSSDTIQATTGRQPRVTGQLWQTEAAARIVIGPLKVKSIAASIKIMAQDSDNRLYAWHTDGTLHWSRKIDGKLLSEVVLTLEGFLMFNTADRVYRVRPEDGANAGGSPPFTLPAATTTGLVYNDHRRDGSFYIFAENGNVYGFQSDGLPLSRMRRKEAGVPAFQPVSFVTGGVFHMVMTDSDKRLHCFDETGKNCFQPIQLEGEFIPYLGVDIHTLTRRIVMSGKDGRVWVTNLEGLQFRLLPSVSGAGKRHFALADLGSDTRKDYLVASDTHVALHAYEGSDFKRLWEYKTPHQISGLHVVQADERTYPLVSIEMGRHGLMILNEKGEPLLSSLLEGNGKPVILGQDVVLNRNGQLVSLRLR